MTGSVALCAQELGFQIPASINICCLVGGFFGSIFCDIDERYSFIGRILWPLSYLFYIVNLLFRFLTLFFPKNSRICKNLKMISFCAAHRGIMHWPSTALLLCILNCLFAILVCWLTNINLLLGLTAFILGFFTGMISHLLYDFISGHITLLAPFSMKRYGFMIIPSGSIFDIFLIRTISILGSFIILEKVFM